MDPKSDSADYAFVLKLTDQPGGMEVIGATFAHRGVSVVCSLGSDGSLDPDGRATVIVTFHAPPAKKEVLRRALGRLSRVQSLVEYPLDSTHLRKTAMFRMGGKFMPAEKPPAHLEEVAWDEVTGETTYLLVDRPMVVDAILDVLRKEGWLTDAATAVIGL